MQLPTTAQITGVSIAIALLLSVKLAVDFNEKELALLDAGLKCGGVERVSIGSFLWGFIVKGKRHYVLVPPGRLQATFNEAFTSMPIERSRDSTYWVLLAACLLPSYIAWRLHDDAVP